ncbi:MAG TPA: peptidylprolyl isomerase [Thermotogota bacterium]|nr:peptidylprolyl isomerase [Sedimentisphaerales bacterium]HQG98473.1 peptidylprolyl isomerase [Thermotogota bacterium]
MAIVVNGQRIEDREIQEEATRLRPSYEQVFSHLEPSAREAQLLDWSKENVIERVLLRQEARNSGPAIPTSEIEAAFARLKERYEKIEDLYKEFNADSDEKVKEMIELQMKVEHKIGEIYARTPKPTEAEIARYFEENKERFASGEQIRVAHIVKYVNWQTDEAAAHEVVEQARKEIAAGTPFEMVAPKYTDCADRGGDLGYVVRGQLVEEFEDVVFNLNVGQVSDVFRTRFGFHIAKLYDRRPPAVPPLKEIHDQVAEQAAEHKREQALGEYLDLLRSQAKVEEV